jgi:hypothetical protein
MGGAPGACPAPAVTVRTSRTRPCTYRWTAPIHASVAMPAELDCDSALEHDRRRHPTSFGTAILVLLVCPYSRDRGEPQPRAFVRT